MLLRASLRALPRIRAIGLFVVLATASALAFSACESSKTSVGSDLLNSITGQETHSDTLTFSLTNPDAIDYATFQLQASTASSKVLLVGEANNLRGIMMLRFPIADEETELLDVYNYDAAEWDIDTLTITPTEVAADSAAYMLLSLESYITDPDIIPIEGWVVDNEWLPEDSVMTEVPASYFTGTPAFTGDTLAYVEDDSGDVTSLTYIALNPTTLSSMLDTTLSFAIRAVPPSNTMAQVQSLETDEYPPQINVWLKATAYSTYADTTVDTLINRSYVVSRDMYRLERLADPPQPVPGSMLISSGDMRRGYIKINRFDVWAANADSTLPAELTANKAVLELTLEDHGNSFQTDSATLEVLELGEAFDLDSAMVGGSVITSDRFSYTSYFDTDEVRDTTDTNIRRFDISDIINRWWMNPDYNSGLMITTGIETRYGNEMRRVDAVEVVGARLILTTTMPPDFELAKPASEGEVTE